MRMTRERRSSAGQQFRVSIRTFPLAAITRRRAGLRVVFLEPFRIDSPIAFRDES
jgi:hypothetical protein